MSLSLIPAQEIDPDALARFLRDAVAPDGFRRSQSSDYYQWLLRPVEASTSVAFVARDGARIAGALCAVLRPIRVGDVTIPTAKLEEMRTDPQDRGRGVMRLVFDAVADGCAERGAHTLFAGPTSPFSYPIFVGRFGFEAPFTIPTFLRPIRVPRVGLPVPVWGRGDSCTATGGDRLPDDAAIWLDDTRQAGPVAVERTAASLRWRYEAHPDAYRYVVLREGDVCRGVAVWKRTVQRGLRIANVVELLGRTAEDDARLLLHVATDARSSSDVELVALWKPRRLTSAALLARGFVRYGAPTPFLLRDDPDLDTRTRRLLRDPIAWELAMGDYFDV